MSVFGALAVRLDPWDVDYGSELPASGTSAEADASVDVTVEQAGAWSPVPPPADGALPRRLLFIDGVRRIEARVIARTDGAICHGAFASYAVGHVEVGGGATQWGEAHVERILALDSGQTLPAAIELSPALCYRPVSVAKSDVAAPGQRVQDEMRLLEERTARELADAPDTLVVADGPLTFGDPLRGLSVGLVKRLHELYVPSAMLPVLARLETGWRSPLFALESPARFARYSWFLRLAQPHAIDADLAGLVRLEVAASVGLETALRLAGACAAFLPRFAPSRGRDPRAPQNLLPIGALESHLRHLLGDPRLIRRQIQALIAAEAPPARWR